MKACADEINTWLAQRRLKVRMDRAVPRSAAAHRLVEGKPPLAG